MRPPAQTAVCWRRAEGAFVVDVRVQVSAAGSYWPPVLRLDPLPGYPPHTIMRFPVQTVLCCLRAEGAFVVDVAVQASVAGSYRPPVTDPPPPPHTTISLPVHTAECS